MTDEALEAFVTELQNRRLHARREYEVAQALRNEKMQEKTRLELDHTLSMLRKDLDQIDKKLDKVTERMVKIRALRTRIKVDQREDEMEKDTRHATS